MLQKRISTGEEDPGDRDKTFDVIPYGERCLKKQQFSILRNWRLNCWSHDWIRAELYSYNAIFIINFEELIPLAKINFIITTVINLFEVNY